MLNELELAKRLQAKDNIAFQELINEFGSRLLRTAKALTTNEPEAEELVCNTFTNAFLGINKFKQEAGLFTWLYRILLNEIYHQLRWRKKDRGKDPSFQPMAKLMVTPEPKQGTISLFRQYLPGLLNRLSPDQREVILLKYLEGMKIKEVATVLKIPENTVKTRLHRGLINLREILE